MSELNANKLLEINDLSISFTNGAETSAVVKNVSFEIGRGEALGVVGESGSGKSMTSLAIMGLLPPKAQVSGSIHFDGQDLLELGGKAMRRIRGNRIAMIFQDPISSLNPYFTVGLQIAEAYRAHRGGSRRDARKVAIEAMNRVKIRDAERRVDHYPHQFSGGMRQRIMIAMALVCEPELIIADEPTTALDVTVQAQVLDLISELREATGASMLFITHDLAVVSQVADRVLVLRNGEEMERGTVQDIFSNPQSDYTNALLDATPRLDDNLPAPPVRAGTSTPTAVSADGLILEGN